MHTHRTILWVIFSMSLLFLWDGWQKHQGHPSLFGPPSSERPAGEPPIKANHPVDASLPTPSAQSEPLVAVRDGGNPVSRSEPVRIRTDVLAVEIDPMGGEIERAELLAYADAAHDGGPVLLLSEQPGRMYLAQTGLVGPMGSKLPNHRSAFQVEEGPRELSENVNDVVVTMSAEEGGVRMTRQYRFKRGSYVIEVRNEISNLGATLVKPTLYMQLTRDGHAPPGESSFYKTYTGPVVYTEQGKFQKVGFDEIEKGKGEFVRSAHDGWIGLIQHYFVSAWVPVGDALREFEVAKVDTNLYTVRMRQALPELAPGGMTRVEAKLYVGPQNQNVLAEVAPGLDLAVDYGWFTMIAKPLFWLLNQLYRLVQNWGWAIVILTVLIKLAFFPLQAASYRSMATMKRVAPKLQALRERHGNDRLKMNQAMMDLYRTEKINPLGGCLPMLVQIPVFISLYWVLLASVEMRDAPWILWIKDLASPDALFGTVPFIHMPIGLLPLLMAATMFIQTKLNPTPPDPMQAKLMLWMPLVFSLMFFYFPSGLVLYWLVNNLFSIAQQWVITRRIEGKPVWGRAV
jgi:YidC/Oxa1 family membrane protein insertase